MRFTIIIVNYNTKEYLKFCLDSIISQNKIFDYEIIVVDNASSDGTVEMLENDFSEIKVIQNDKNMGFGAANNQGAHIAKGEYLFFLNSDTTIQKNALQEIENALANTYNYGAIGFKIMNSDRSLQPSCGNFPTLWNIIAEALFLDRIFKPKSSYHILNEKKYQNKFNPDWVSGSCFMIKKKVFDKVSGFDEKFFLYVEEVDLCYRIKQEGYKNQYLPIDVALHYNRASMPSKKLAIVFTHHNLLYFFKKHRGIISAVMLYLLFISKSTIYSILGFLLGLISKEQRNKSRSYSFLFITLLFKPLYKKYENSFKQ